MYVFALIGAKQAGRAVGSIEGAAGTLPLEVVDDVGEAATGQQILADGKTGRADNALGCYCLQPVVAGLLECREICAPVGTALPARDFTGRLQLGFKQRLAIA